MADDGQIVIQIVLDDGSVQQGFATIKKEGKKAGDEVSKSFGGVSDAIDEISPRASRAFSKLQTIISNPFIAAGASIAAVGATIAGAFKLTVIGDQALQAERSFNIFAQNAGLNAQQLKQSFEDVSLGIIDTGDAVEASRIAIAELGKEAQKLPQVFKLAQNVAVTTGQDVLQTYEKINQAILSGNTRSLKSIGIFIDGEQVLNDYAKALGKTAAELTQTEKQAAVLNATLEKGNKIFGEASVGSLTLGQNVQRLRSEFAQLFEEVAKQVSSSAIGQFFRDSTQQAADALKARREALETEREAFNNADTAAKGLEQTRARILAIEQKIAATPTAGPAEADTRIIRLQEELNLLKGREVALAQFIDANQQIQASEQASLAAKQADEAQTKLTNDQLAKQIELRKTAQKQLEEFRQAEVSYQQEIINGTVQVGANIGLFSNQIATLGNAIKFQAGQAKLSYADLANTINTGFVSALQNVGAALVTGANAGKAFGDAILGTIGQLAVQLGQFFILTGIAQSATPILGLSGGAAIAAGVALTVFGGALSAIAKQSAPTTAAPGGTAGPTVAEAPEFRGGEFDLAEVERQAPGTEVVVNINGDVLDSDETGIRIVDILNTAFDKKGVTLRRGLA